MAISSEGYEKAVWQSYGPARSVDGVEVNGYTIEPGADLLEAGLAGANLSGANLSSAQIYGANLDRADLSGARADGHTTWSKGFDPEAAGVIFED